MNILDVIDAELERIHEDLNVCVSSPETRIRLLDQLKILIQFLTDHHKTIYIDTEGKLHR